MSLSLRFTVNASLWGRRAGSPRPVAVLACGWFPPVWSIRPQFRGDIRIAPQSRWAMN